MKARYGIKLITLALFLFAVLAGTSGCYQTMDTTEVGLVYKKLPFALGGFKGRVEPGNMALYCPLWTTIHVLDTRVMSLTWASRGQGNFPNRNDSLNTRAMDGNQVWLDITVQFFIDPTKVNLVLTGLGANRDSVQNIVTAYARSQIRTSLGELYTDHFYDNKLRYDKTGKVKAEMNKALNPVGIKIDAVLLDDHRFDAAYQKKIDQTKICLPQLKCAPQDPWWHTAGL